MDLGEPHTWQWIWLVAMVVFGLGEMAAAGSFFLAPFALGAAVAAILAFLNVPLGIEWAAFLVVSVVSFLAMRPLARRLDRENRSAGIGANRLLGQAAQVTEAIGNGHMPGMVLLGGEKWRAESADGQEIAADTPVVVTDVRGTRVVVEPRIDGPDTQPRTDNTPPTQGRTH
ncbi:MAG TPA: NfeD family protein [Acidimicrobiales bacterium]|nr:NfeD family protein [Acidimicrobiales bacterium]